MVKAEPLELPVFFLSHPEFKEEARHLTPGHYPLIPRLIFLA
jgi:hypothetical protein